AGDMLMFDQGLSRDPPSSRQMRSLKDHAIENGFNHVWHGVTDRPLWSRPREEEPEPVGNTKPSRRRMDRRVVPFAKPPFGLESPWTEEQKRAGWPRSEFEHEKELAASVANRPRSLPGVGELHALSDVGASVGGEYAATQGTLGRVFGTPTDALLWAHAN